MGSQGAGTGAAKPNVGDTLMVIHEFQARSSDELSLAKGDRVELIERDDEFGDGWFLGRHLTNGNTGLFPEVYTRPAVKAAPTQQAGPVPGAMASAAVAPAAMSVLSPLAEVPSEPSESTKPTPKEEPSSGMPAAQPVMSPQTLPMSPPAQTSATLTSPMSDPPQFMPGTPTPVSETPKPMPMSQSTEDPAISPLKSTKPNVLSRASTMDDTEPAAAMGILSNTSQDSQVLNDTLNVINEHITDMRSPASNGALRETLRAPSMNDSGSEYSAPIDSRMSYIQGEETDEEEGVTHTRQEVEAWTPDDVAEFLFTNGVERQHCDVFRDQDITGEVLLGMDQSSLFIKAFDLGSVGRRLKTWHKIKGLQDEVGELGPPTRRTTQTYGSDAGSDEARMNRSRNNTMSSVVHRPMSGSSRRVSSQYAPKASPGMIGSPGSPSNLNESMMSPASPGRPSAASVRDMNHSRRHSSMDYRNAGAPPAGTPKLTPNGSFLMAANAHKKQASFDKEWTLGGAQRPPRPLSSTGLHDVLSNSEHAMQDSAVDLDRGYFSGGEAEGRKRNLLKKRESVTHSRKGSYTDEQRVRSATALSRHSRLGSDSGRDANQSAQQKYYGVSTAAHRRTASANTANTTSSVGPPPPAKDAPSPAVTRLDNGSTRGHFSNFMKPSGSSTPWLSSVVSKPAARAISETLGGRKNPMEPPPKDGPMRSPGSSTPSGGPSMDSDSITAAKDTAAAAAAVPNGKKPGRKGKKETSAYTRGLQATPPKVAMADADYSGWMRKKSSNLMTTWKPRLFVLKGRRLAYYYSEDDDQEKGLIDISFHRVLPADNDKLAGIHATVSDMVSNPSHLLPNSGSGDANDSLEKGDDSVFIFKLVPPRAGLSRAVNFTKPTVHYFALPNLKQGRLWMAALMKATIDRDDSTPIATSYQQKTISLTKARAMRHRPPALMNLDETEEEQSREGGGGGGGDVVNGLGLFAETDSGVSGMAGGSTAPQLALNFDGGRDAAPS